MDVVKPETVKNTFVSNAYCYTLYEFDRYIELVKSLHDAVIYHVAAIEKCPDTGRLHIQGFVRFNKAVRSSTFVKKLTNGEKQFWHTRPNAESDFDQQRYCKKGEQPKDEWIKDKEKGPNYGKNLNLVVEYGQPSCQGQRNDLRKFVDTCKQGPISKKRIAEDFTSVLAKYPRFVETVQEIYRPKPQHPGFAQLHQWQQDILAQIENPPTTTTKFEKNITTEPGVAMPSSFIL